MKICNGVDLGNVITNAKFKFEKCNSPFLIEFARGPYTVQRYSAALWPVRGVIELKQLGQKSSTASLIKRLDQWRNNLINQSMFFYQEWVLSTSSPAGMKVLTTSIRPSSARTLHFCCTKQSSSLMWTSLRKAGIVAMASESESSITTRQGSVTQKKIIIKLECFQQFVNTNYNEKALRDANDAHW